MKYRKKPVVVDAVQWNGENKIEMCHFIGIAGFFIDENGDLIIRTLEGNMHASVGDYIIKGVEGEFYACKPDIFEKTYDAVEQED